MRYFLLYRLPLIFFLFTVTNLYAQDRYWVNGSGNWNDPSHWSVTSGGSSGASVPTEENNVFIDKNSFDENGGNIQIKGEVACNDFYWQYVQGDASFKSSAFLFKRFTSATFKINGSMKVDQTFNSEYYGDLIFSAGEHNTLEINSPLSADIIFDNNSGAWTFLSDINTDGDIIVQSGSVDLNNKQINTNAFIGSGDQPRTIHFRNSKIVTGSLDFENSSNLNYTNENYTIEFINDITGNNLKQGILPVNVAKSGTKGTFKLEEIIFDTTSCSNSSDGAITISISGGSPNYHYQLFEENSSGTLLEETTIADTLYKFSGYPGGSYYIEVRENGGGVTGNPVELPSPDPFLPGSITVANPLSCFDGSDGALEANPTGGNTPYSYTWFKYNTVTETYDDISISTKIATGLDQGLYKVEIRDANGCGDGGFVSNEYFFTNPPDDVNIPDSLRFDDITSTGSCAGQDNGTIDITASGGTGDLDYYLVRTSDATPIPGAGYDEDGYFDNLQPDTYETYVIDANGCTKRGDDITIQSLTIPTADAGTGGDACGLSFDLDATPSIGVGTWTKTSGSGNATFSDASDPDATVTVDAYDTYIFTWTENNNGCTDSDNVTVNFYETPVAEAGVDQYLCDILNTTLAADDPTVGNGSWSKQSGPGNVSFGDNTAFNSTVTMDSYGEYVLLWTVDNNGCIDTDVVTISFAEAADAGADQNLCGTLSATMNGNNPTAGTGTWSVVSGPGTVNFDNVNTHNTTATASTYGTYVLRWTVDNNGGCNTTDDVTINFAEAADAGPDQDVCGALVTNLAANEPSSGTGTWSLVSGPGTVTFGDINTYNTTATVSVEGSYVFRWTIDNSGACNTTDDVTVNYIDAADAGTDQELCNTLIATLDGNDPTVGTGTWSLVSGPGTITFGDENVHNTTATASDYGTYVLRWTISNGGGCNTSDEVSISFAEGADAGTDQELCGVFATTLEGNDPSAGTGTWSLVSGPGTATFGDENLYNSSVTVTDYGTYVFRWTVDNGVSCNTSDDVTISFADAADAGTDQYLCDVQTTTLAGNEPTVGTGTWSVISGPGTVTFTDENVFNTDINVTAYGSYVLRWTIDNNGACNTTSDVTINFAEAADAGTDQDICATLDVTLAANAPTVGTGTWSVVSGPGTVTFNDENLNNTTATASSYGTYVLRWTIDNNGTCNTTDEVTINFAEAADAGADQNLCGTLTATLAGNDPTVGTGTWSVVSGPGTVTFGNVNVNNTTATVTDYGTYVLRWTVDNNGSCSTDSDVTVTFAESASAGADQDICGTFTVALEGNEPTVGTGTWSVVSGPGTVTFDDVNVYNTNATVTDYGTYTLRWTIDNNGDCSTTDDVVITFYQAPTAYAGADTTLCYNSAYQINDADTTNSPSLLWETLGDGTFDDVTIIDPEYTPGENDLLNGYVDLVLTASANPPCSDVTDTIRITYLDEMLVSIGKPTPFYIDSNTTHIDVSVKISDHDYIAYLGVYLVSPNDSIVELKPLCTNPFPGNFDTDVSYSFYNDPEDTSAITAISECNPSTGRYQIPGDWGKLHGMDPANGAWRIRLVDNRSLGDYDGLLEEATLKFSDLNAKGTFESVLYADSSINLTINEYNGSGPYAQTDYIIPITGLETSCYGECDATAVATASGGQPPYLTYEWSDTSDFSNIIATTDTVDLCAGTYYVRVYDSFGCVAYDSVVVTEPPQIIITKDSVTHNQCYADTAGTITLEFAGGRGTLVYSIDGGTTWKNSGETFENLGAGDYLATIMDGTGCTKDTTITITEPTEIKISYTVTPINCYGSDDGEIEISATGGTGPYQFSLDSIPDFSNATGLFSGLGVDTLYIGVQDALGCEVYGDTVYMTYPDSVQIDSLDLFNTTCAGDNNDGAIVVYASGGTGEMYYSLDGGTLSTDSAFLDLSPADYTIHVEDERGCTIYADSTVTITGPIPIVYDSIQIVNVTTCYGDSTGQISVYASGGSGTYQYSLDGVNFQDSRTFNDLPAGTHTISIIDDGGCVGPDTSVIVSQPTRVRVSSLDVDHPSECNGETEGSIIIHAIGGVGGYEFLIDTTGAVWKSDSLFENLPINSYHFEIADSNGCTASIDTAIVLIESVTATFNVTPVTCNGASDGSITVVPSEGTPPYNYTWGHDPFLTGATAVGLSAGRYYVTVTDSNVPTNCVYEDSVDITDPAPINISVLDFHDKYCINSYPLVLKNALGMVSVGASGGVGPYTYSWTGPGTFTDTTSTIDSLETGDYSLILTDSLGCVATFDTIVVESTDFDITINYLTADQDTICGGGDVEFEVDIVGADTLRWQLTEFVDGTPVNSSIENPITVNPFVTTFTPENTTIYEVIGRNEYCYQDYEKDTITVHPVTGLYILDWYEEDDHRVVVTPPGNPTVLTGVVTDTTVSATFEWFPKEGVESPFNLITNALITKTQLYKLTSVTDQGCYEEDTLLVSYVPDIDPYSGFSPNDDGINDYWHIENIGDYKNNIVIVYNRWGIKVFEQEGYDNDDSSKRWDGKTSNGKGLPIGTYYYVVDVREDGMEAKNGPVTIMR